MNFNLSHAIGHSDPSDNIMAVSDSPHKSDYLKNIIKGVSAGELQPERKEPEGANQTTLHENINKGSALQPKRKQPQQHVCSGVARLGHTGARALATRGRALSV